MSNTWIILSIAGGLIIVILAIVAGVLLYKVHKLNQTRQAQAEAMQVESDAQRERINKSIQVIARAIGSDHSEPVFESVCYWTVLAWKTL